MRETSNLPKFTNFTITHAVAVRLGGAWGVITWCRSLAEARICMAYWRARSSWTHKIIKLKE